MLNSRLIHAAANLVDINWGDKRRRARESPTFCYHEKINLFRYKLLCDSTSVSSPSLSATDHIMRIESRFLNGKSYFMDFNENEMNIFCIWQCSYFFCDTHLERQKSFQRPTAPWTAVISLLGVRQGRASTVKYLTPCLSEGIGKNNRFFYDTV